MNNYAKIKQRSPRHIWGAVIGAVASIGSSLLANSSNKANQRRAFSQAEREQRQTLFNEATLEENALTLDERLQKETGNLDASYYAHGGNLKMGQNKPFSRIKKSPTHMNKGGALKVSQNGSDKPYEDSSEPIFITHTPSFSTQGGGLIPLANGAEKVVGNKHSENIIDGNYGVELSKNGNTVAEVEDGEIITDGQNVFSDQLKYNSVDTYADKAEKIAKKRGKLEETLAKTTDKRRRNSLERKVGNLSLAENTLFTEQELHKLVEGKEILDNDNELAQGGSLLNPNNENNRNLWTDTERFDWAGAGKTAMNLTPMLVDNVANFIQKAPKLPIMLNRPTPRLETRVNVAPQMAAIRRGTRNTIDNISNNTSNSAIARASIVTANLRGAELEGNILGQAENLEREARNKNVMLEAETMATNASLGNQSAMMEFQRQNDINARISGNFADLAKDLGNLKTINQIDANIEEQEQAAIMSDNTGTTLRTYLDTESFVNKLRGNPKLKSFYRNIALKTKPDGSYVNQQMANEWLSKIGN